MKRQLIYLNKIFKAFKVKNQEVTVLQDVNLEIVEGDFAIIFGPSGCGKSTLLHVILGLEEPSSGQARLFDQNMYSSSEDERSEFRKNHIGMVYQQPNWIKSLSVVENVAFALSLLGVEKQQALAQAHTVLKTVGMENWADYRPTELSSGQQQKVALARALILNPELIIADEPTGNLDYQSGIELMELFRRLNQQGKTILMVTHNIDNLDYAQSIVQIFNGQVVHIFNSASQSIESIKNALLHKIVVAPQLQPSAAVSPSKMEQNKKTNRWFAWLAPAHLKRVLPTLFSQLLHIFRFLGLLAVYLLKKATNGLLHWRVMPVSLRHGLQSRLSTGYNKVIAALEVHTEKTIAKVDLIDLSLKNMISKRTRTFITVGGMTIGIATIVFLVSVGYGLEKMVVSRVARLEEMRQIDATPAVASNIKLTDASLAKFKDIAGISKILPMIGVVGTINYQSSNTDVAVYGVLSDYLKESAIQPTEGTVFKSETLTYQLPSNDSSPGQVAGVSLDSESTTVLPKMGAPIGSVEYSIFPDEYVRVRTQPQASGRLLGYTRRVEGTSQATEHWGGTYISEDAAGRAAKDANGKAFGRWLKVNVLVWEEQQAADGSTTYVEKRDASGNQIWAEGYVAELKMTIERTVENIPFSTALGEAPQSKVLGDATESAELAEAGRFIDISELDQTATIAAQTTATAIRLPDEAQRDAVVNQALLAVLGIEGDAVGKKFTIAFTATGELVSDGAKIESVPVEYTIVGVTPQSKTPIVYVPIRDVKQLGIQAYSQTKLVVDSQDSLAKVRKQVEVLGFKTTSVVDTVSQIENLFSSLRLLLGVLGVVALSVAALGMLNTLTVSLLERTREVGMMKAIGMKSGEVQELYLTESMIMGILGGVGGLTLGFLAGKAASLVLSTYAVTKGYGVLDISFIPVSFVILILVISVLVGLLTGIYPARRATKISALDALRYE